MAQNARLTSHDCGSYYDEQTVESLDEPAGGPELMAYGSTSSMAKRDYFLPEDIPLFLSNDAAEPGPGGFGDNGTIGSDFKAVSSRIFKAGFLVASAAAIAVAVASVENPLAVFANAKASLIGVQSHAPPKSALESVVAAPPATRPESAAPSPIGTAAMPPAAEPAPTRDEIASALRAAHQSQPEIRQPAATVAAPPPARRLGADELAALVKRAKSLIAIGDIAPARLLLERAADAQEASAALLLAQTWDPAVLGTSDSRSITPDPAKARDWYRKAAQFGSQDAQLRLSQLQH
jgi:TPR repeat protein